MMSDNGNSVIQETRLEPAADHVPPMKSRKPVLMIVVLACIMLVIAAGAVITNTGSKADLYGTQEWEGIRFTVDQPLEGAILLKIDNHSDRDMNFGWVDQSTIILETTDGTYTRKVRREIGDRSSGYVFLVFPQARGIPQSLAFNSVGTGLGADSSFRMDLTVRGRGRDTLSGMNFFETVWAYVRLAYYWMISASDPFGIILRIIIGAIAVTILAYFFSALKPRKSIRAKVLKKYIQKTTHYQNGMCTGTTESYIVVFQLENGKKRKVNVRSRYHYQQIDTSGWGLLTMKGIIFVNFEYLPSV